MDLENLTRLQLQQRLEAFGAKTSGKKSELIERLSDYVERKRVCGDITGAKIDTGDQQQILDEKRKIFEVRNLKWKQFTGD